MFTTHRNKRLFDRFQARYPAKFEYSARDYGTEVFLRDFSARGIRLISKTRCFVHDTLAVMVELPDGLPPLKLTGRVVWIREAEPGVSWEIGAEFHKVQFVRMHRLYRFVEADV